LKLNYLDDIPRGELSPVGVASLSRSLQENSSASPHHGVLLGEGFETLSFPLATRCFGKHKNCCSGLNCADNCTRSGRGVCRLIPWEVQKMKNILSQVWREQEGQDIAEYAVMLAVILVIVVATVRLIGSNANNVFSSVASSVQ